MNSRRVATANLALLLSMSTLVSAQEKVHWDIVSKIREESFERSQVMDHIWYLSDVIGPRLAGSAGIGKAQLWARSKMDEMGLTATALEPWGETGVSWEQKYTSIHMIEPIYQPIIGYPYAFSPGTNGKIVGRPVIVDIQNKEDLETYRGKLSGAIVLAHPEKRINERFTADAVRHDKESLAAYAATGANINFQRRLQAPWWQLSPPEDIKEEELEQFFKSENVAVVLNPGRGGDGTVRVGGRQSYRKDATVQNIANAVPWLILVPEHYNRIYRLTEKEIPVHLEIEVTLEISEEPTEFVNVVGEIPGTDLAHEVVMIGAHLDSWHTATGASDNAAGVSVALEAMRILKAIGAEPRRTIRIALWDSEEMGHKGSIAYVAKHFGNPRDGEKPEYDNFSVYFNSDNGAGQFRGVHQQGNELVAPIFDAWMKPFRDLNVETLTKFSNTGSDQVNFDRAGLPGFQFLQDRLAYWTRRWHYNMDFYDHVIPIDLKTNAAVMASFAYHAAMRDEKIPRKIFKDWKPELALLQEDVFKDGNTFTNAIADFDNDGDLDIFVESQFKTLKYRPEFPKRFGSIQHARDVCRDLFGWYNTEHYHSGIGLLTPESVHYGRAAMIVEGRRQVLLDFFGAHPERFVNGAPKPPEIPSAAWINPPTMKTTHQIGAQAVSEASDDLQVPLICNIYGEPVVSNSAASVTRTQHNHAQTQGNPA